MLARVCVTQPEQTQKSVSSYQGPGAQSFIYSPNTYDTHAPVQHVEPDVSTLANIQQQKHSLVPKIA